MDGLFTYAVEVDVTFYIMASACKKISNFYARHIFTRWVIVKNPDLR